MTIKSNQTEKVHPRPEEIICAPSEEEIKELQHISDTIPETLWLIGTV